MYFKRTYLLEFDMLRQKAEALMLMGHGFPDEFVSVPLTQNVALPKNEKILVLASLRDALVFSEVPAQMHRLFGPRGRASRQDVLVAADIDAVSEEEEFEAWTAYRKAKRARKDGRGGGDTGKQVKRKSSVEGRTK